MPEPLLPRNILEALAPARLPLLVDARYDGGGQSAFLADFPETDVQQLQAIYFAVSQLCDVLRELTQRAELDPAEMEKLKNMPQWRQILSATTLLGKTVQLSDDLHLVLHDVRGGSLVGLLGSINLLKPEDGTTNEILRMFCYARDHMKIMRNCLPDIDPARSQIDHETSLHPVSLYREKWTDARIELGGEVKHVNFNCEFRGYIATRCQEFSAVDRIIYNLFNNAAYYGEGSEIYMNMFVPQAEGERNVRFTVHNQIAPAQARTLATLTQGNLSSLLKGGASSGDSGLGMRICTEFVMRAFALRTVAQAISSGYIGVQLVGNVFVAWFHWPQV